MGRANPARAVNDCSDYLFSGYLPEQLPLFCGLSVSVRYLAVLGAVGLCFGSGRALLGQLHFWEPL